MASRYAIRRHRNTAATALAVPRPRLGLGWLVLILGTLLWKASAACRFRLHPDDAAAGRGRRTAQSDRRQPDHDRACDSDRNADRRCAGTYHAEYGRHSRLGSVVRFINDILLSAPSIVIGLFIYQVLVAPMGHFSALPAAWRWPCW